MMHEAIGPIDEALCGLTDFQRATVEAACARLDGVDGLGGRLLVGDEVGLGKTLVARGVVATLLRNRLSLGPLERPFRVEYICSNQALAHENVKKLAVFRGALADQWVSSLKFGRLAELGLKQPPPEHVPLMETCSLTPATSFVLSRGGGNAKERYIIWRAATSGGGLLPTDALRKFFQQNVKGAWEEAERVCQDPLESASRREFLTSLGEPPRLDARALRAAKALGLSVRSWRSLLRTLSETDAGQVTDGTHLTTCVRGGIRQMFVEACARNLKADLFILDEFQRFSALLNIDAPGPGEATDEDAVSEEQVIARRVLHEGSDYATLLLSATPFKALTHLADEEEGRAHEQQLIELLKYLCSGDATVLANYKTGREALLGQLLRLPDSPLAPNSLRTVERDRVQTTLRPYICRTERAAIEPDIEKIFRTVPADAADGATSIAEIASFVALAQLAQALRDASNGKAGSDVMQFHKAAPWSLSFLSGYQLRETLRQYRGEKGVASALAQSETAWIPYRKFENYSLDLTRDAPGGRFAQVLRAAAPEGAERLLWVPPSLANYAADGPFKGLESFSKTLLFSSLVLAPRAISSYVSYECERRLLSKSRKRRSYFEKREDHSRTFRLDGNSVGPVWGLVYPSTRLASVSMRYPDASLEDVRERVRVDLQRDVDRMCERFGSGATRANLKGRWYALAPFLLDLVCGESEADVWRWVTRFPKWSAAPATRTAQAQRIGAMLNDGAAGLGEPPVDLLDWLTDLAIAGPGVCMRRTLTAIWPPENGHAEYGIDVIRHSRASTTETPEVARRNFLIARATDAALWFIDKMNRVESQRVLRAVLPRAKPWMAVAEYGAMGNLQAVFDEYLHLLKSADGTLDGSIDAFHTAIGTGAVSLTAQTLPASRLSDPKQSDKTFHCHYAVPFGNQRGTDEKSINRITNARASFNSPFWPFMLNSTSIGQEGLDFHWYCRRIVHWSLPPNPIDLEQREGRINRFKSLVVRQRVAQAYGPALRTTFGADLWGELFELALKDQRRTDLVPYWHVPRGVATIERIVPAAPFSVECTRLREILRIVSLYRLSFGQPRQQELIENLLMRAYTDVDLDEIRRALLVDLAPIHYYPWSGAKGCEGAA
ncbi:DEAD/DEAH box helicase [Caballeronia sp. Lep1P3]|uniref:DEAD/DEAH box helicase n=1 Tax=Caballeronia sp. Lep1P3 TaxID=2878150 RepID=UPI001FD28C79|nr:DEAD/DEAH box helicase [Caballeronia sp. Lep1P3]